MRTSLVTMKLVSSRKENVGLILSESYEDWVLMTSACDAVDRSFMHLDDIDGIPVIVFIQRVPLNGVVL